MKITPQEEKKLMRLAKMVDSKEVATLEEFDALDSKVEELSSKLDENVLVTQDALESISEELKKKLESELVLEIDREELKGDKGDKGDRGEAGKDGKDGINGKDGKNGLDGRDGVDGVDGLNGKDGSPDTASQIVDKLESLKGEDRLDKKAIKGLENTIDKENLDRAIGIVDQRSSYLVQKVSGIADRVTAIENNDSFNPVDYIQFNTGAIPRTSQPGLTQWNATDETLDLGMPVGIRLQLGQELQLKARNNTGSTIYNGTPVYQSGMLGNRPTIALAKGDADTTSKVIGLLTQDILDNNDGKVTTFGYVRNIDTTGTPYGETWADGDTLWVSKTTVGYLTNTEPAVPHHSDIVGQVVNAHQTQGSILVNIRHHKTLEELSDVDGTPLTTTGQIPVWNQTGGYFDFNDNVGNYLKLNQSTPQTVDSGKPIFTDGIKMATAGHLYFNNDSFSSPTLKPLITFSDDFTSRMTAFGPVDIRSGFYLSMKSYSGGTYSGVFYHMVGAQAATTIFGSQVAGDSGDRRLRIMADGTINWGNGTDGTDVNLFRYAANILKTDDAMIVQAGLTSYNSFAATGLATFQPLVQNSGVLIDGIYGGYPTLSIDGKTGAIARMFTGFSSLHLSENAWFDNANWQRDDTAKKSVNLALDGDSTTILRFRYSAAGSGAITWSQVLTVDTSGRFGFGTAATTPLTTTQIDIARSANDLTNGVTIRNANSSSGSQSRLQLYNDLGTTNGTNGAALFLCASGYAAPYTNALGFWNYQAGAVIIATSNAARWSILSTGHLVSGTDGTGNFYIQTAGNLVAPVWRPAADSTTALKIAKANGTTAVVTFDTTNSISTFTGRSSINLSILPTTNTSGAGCDVTAGLTGDIRMGSIDTGSNTFGGAAFQLFSNSNASFPGRLYFDSGSSDGGTTGANIYFRTKSTSPATRMVISPTKIAIGGSTLPTTAAIALSGGDVLLDNTMGIAWRDSTATELGRFIEVFSDNHFYLSANKTGSKMFLRTNGTTTAMMIDEAQKIGMGTTTPDTKLQVVGDLKVGDDNTNYTNFDTTGHQTMVGTAQPWEDLRIEPSARTTSANAPTFEKWYDNAAGTSRGVYLYSFDNALEANEKEVFFTMQMPHAWNGGAISVHVHWVPAATENTTDVIWGLEYTWKDIGEVYGDTTLVTSSTTLVPDDANITANKHYISEFADISPGTTADGLSSILIGRLYRNSSNASDTYTDKVGLLYIDAHYQISSIGSNDEYTK